jgi:glycosyltransferase involved in cell wall biosynthesis
VVFERDDGPADGLNRGFARASGDVFCYLNSDDEFEPGAFARVASCLASNPQTAVVCGHAWIVDRDGGKLRRVWSDPYNRMLVAYGAAIQIQPSTFIRAGAFRRAGGFNVKNRISWDAELLFELMSSGARIDAIGAFLSLYRVHPASITGAALHGDLAAEQRRRGFERMMGRPWRPLDGVVKGVLFVLRQLRNPPAFFERLLRGKVHGRSAQALRPTGGIRRFSGS